MTETIFELIDMQDIPTLYEKRTSIQEFLEEETVEQIIHSSNVLQMNLSSGKIFRIKEFILEEGENKFELHQEGNQQPVTLLGCIKYLTMVSKEPCSCKHKEMKNAFAFKCCACKAQASLDKINQEVSYTSKHIYDLKQPRHSIIED
jgi:hypothetical protein